MDLVKTEAIERVHLARHDRRPYASDFIERIFSDFFEVHGDRKFMDDKAMLCGLAHFQGRPVAVIAHRKGRDVRERQDRNFGMPKPDGFRKAIRVMKLAEKFSIPIFTLIDTQGAYPGIDAEARGQAEAIASNLREMARLEVPVIVTITGEGFSGGALAIGIGDVVNIFENGVFTVITPEGCAAILWKDQGKTARAAECLKLTATDLFRLGIVDRIVPEPEGGAQNDWEKSAELLAKALRESLETVDRLTIEERLNRRYLKYRRLGALM